MAVVAVLWLFAVVGAAFEPEVVWRPLAGPLAVLLVTLLLWRRAHPLTILLVTFGLQTLVDVISYPVADGTTLLGASFIAGLMTNYAVWRWGSGREAAVGTGFVLACHVLTDLVAGQLSPWETPLNALIWLFAAAVGLIMRYQASLRDQRIDEARLQERHQLARELHDTVAHHVSAITIQAQAGQALAAQRPEAAVEVLATIEESAARTLTDMRRMVTVLRDADAGQLDPQPGLTQVAGLATTSGLPVEVELHGDLDDLSPAVEASLFRMAQEAVTNARRHARHATRVSLRIEGTPDEVRLLVSDDGDLPVPTGSPSGFGLVGMAERAAMLGGTLVAHPGRDRGWLVEVVLPRDGGPQ
ncbi:MAG: sensor histidine kinase [Actinomycetia bacterium]|nr:sensor histidine kinase [Actinomycetes bacterium]